MSEMEPIKIQAVNSSHEGSRKDVWQEGRICCLLVCKYYFLHLFQSCSSNALQNPVQTLKALLVCMQTGKEGEVFHLSQNREERISKIYEENKWVVRAAQGHQ